MHDIYLIGFVIILALLFDFINGFHDTANAIATCVATRAISPKVAIVMSAILNFWEPWYPPVLQKQSAEK